LWEEIQSTRAGVAQTHGALEEATQAASQAKVDADVASAVDRFKVDHPDLTDEEIQSIRNYSSANVNIQGVMSNFPLDPVTGLVKALEIGSMSDPAERDDRAEQDKTRAGNLSKLTGSSGSATRRAPKPVKASNWNEAASMIAKELEALGGTQ
jgi:hypothetical protein